ncbi:MAG: tRNA lysidine(34) synthetase TilS [Flavobacteriales bacterium]
MILNEIKQQFERYIPDYQSKKYLIACSAGPDSMVLSHAMLTLNLDIQLVHVNFGLRGIESDGDEAFVQSFADANALVLHKKKISIAHETQSDESTQMTARRTRYAFFQEVIEICKIDYCLTAHHLDDNIETFFLNLIRGAGIKGLTGIPVLQGKLFRPMLDISKSLIYDFAFKNHINYRLDSSNAENYYKRNLLRNEVLPHIHKHFPAFSQKMLETFKYMKDAEYLLNESILQFKKVQVQTTKDKVIINKNAILSNPAGRTIFKEILSEFGIVSAVSNDIYRNLTSNTGAVFNAGKNSIIINRDKLEITPEYTQFDTRYLKPENHFNITIEEQLPDLQIVDNNDVCILDADKITDQILLRTWKKGDVFYPLGMTGKKKLSDYFTEKKLSREEKEKQLLLCIGNEIAWVVNYRIDRRFVPEAHTKRYAIITPVKKH